MFCIIIYKKQYNSTKNNRFFKKKQMALPPSQAAFCKSVSPSFSPRLSIHRHGVVVMNWSTDDVLKDGGPLSDGVKVWSG